MLPLTIATLPTSILVKLILLPADKVTLPTLVIMSFKLRLLFCGLPGDRLPDVIALLLIVKVPPLITGDAMATVILPPLAPPDVLIFPRLEELLLLASPANTSTLPFPPAPLPLAIIFN